MYRNWTTDEDAQLLEMLRLNCHRSVIAAALARTDIEIRARIGMLKALRSSEIAFDRLLTAETASRRSHAES